MAVINKFMIIDDNDATSLFFTVILQELGVTNVMTARTGEEALALAKESLPNFLIVSWELKTMPGTILVQRLRTQMRRRHVPYMLYSKRLTPEDLVLTKEMGMKNVFSLPIDKAKARDEIAAMIKVEADLTPEEQVLRKIELAIAENKPSEALKYYDNRLRKKGPHFVKAQTLLGEIWLMTNQLKKAEDAFKAALAEDPDAFEARSSLANVYSRMGNHQEALVMLKAMSEKSPKNLLTMVNLGATYANADRHDEAKKVFSKVSTIDPDIPGLKDERAKLAFKEGDMSLAAQLISETQNGDSMARHFNNVAIALTQKEQYDQAIETYQNAIKILVNKAKVHALRYNLGLAYTKKGDLLRGFGEFAASYKDDPTFDKAYLALAKVTKEMSEKGMRYDQKIIKEIKTLRSAQKVPVAKAS